MLCCDTFAALCTSTVLLLAASGQLHMWHLYLLNGLTGLMNTVQQPAADVAVTLLTPEKHYQRVSGLRSLSYSLNNMLAPALGTALYTLLGLEWVILFDLATFRLAFCSLLLFIPIPQGPKPERTESLLRSTQAGLRYLGENRGILDLILFLAAINLTASHVQRGPACPGPYSSLGWRKRPGPGPERQRCVHAWGQHSRFPPTGPKKPGTCHLQYPAVGNVHRKFYSRPGA